MGSGKQVSFALGEVSPALRFRADGNFYGQALSKLKNAFVRKSGGVSNRAGTKFFKEPTFQNTLPEDSSSTVGVRVFSAKASDGADVIIQMIDDDSDPFVVYNASTGDEITLTTGSWSAGAITETRPVLTTIDKVFLEEAECVIKEGYAFITAPVRETTNGVKLYAVYTILITETLGVYSAVWLYGYPTPVEEGIANPVTGSTTGLAPDLPVNYRIYIEDDFGVETLFMTFASGNGHPHSQRSTTLTIDLPTTLPSGRVAKQYNFYRASSLNGYYALVGRVSPSGNGSTFADYLTVPDLTQQPPSDYFLVTKTFFDMKKLVFYKERAVFAFFDYSGNRRGTLNCSKLGAISMFPRPLTPNSVDAFSFSIPTDKSSEIVNMLSMNRLVVFTAFHTFVIRGGQGGVLTPQEVNPELIYHEGCAVDVNPVAAGSRGYFVSNDKSKLLMINQQRDDVISVIDVSIYSDHLFETRDIRKLAVASGQENILWILKRDGTLISLTVSEEGGVLGFATHDTDGFIEDITMVNTLLAVHDGDTETQKAQSLFISVIRDGVRYYEKMQVRNDISTNRFMYADCASTFGSIIPPIDITVFTDGIKIVQQTDYLAGSTLSFIYNTNPGPFDNTWVGKRLDVFYDYDDNGVTKERKLRLEVTAYTNNYTLDVLCEEDIPTALQNTVTKKWLEAINQVTGLTHLANKDVSVFADGMLLSSPNNPEVDTLTVDGSGVLDLPNYYNWGYVGLPYTTEIETLNLEASDARTFTDVGKLINVVGIGVNRSSGGLVGQTGVKELIDMEQFKTNTVESIEEVPATYSGYLEVMFPSTWEPTGRVLFKQVDPLPMSILSVYPKGVIGE